MPIMIKSDMMPCVLQGRRMRFYLRAQRLLPVHSPTVRPNPNLESFLTWSSSADNKKLTPTLRRSSRYAATCTADHDRRLKPVEP